MAAFQPSAISRVKSVISKRSVSILIVSLQKTSNLIFSKLEVVSVAPLGLEPRFKV